MGGCKHVEGSAKQLRESSVEGGDYEPEQSVHRAIYKLAFIYTSKSLTNKNFERDFSAHKMLEISVF